MDVDESSKLGLCPVVCGAEQLVDWSKGLYESWPPPFDDVAVGRCVRAANRVGDKPAQAAVQRSRRHD